MVSDYDDVVRQQDIDFLHDHVRKNFGEPRFIRSSQPAWDMPDDEYTIDILCLMALADAFGFEYGEFVAIDL